MHWIYPSIGGAFFGFGLGAISDEALTLVIDCYAGVSTLSFGIRRPANAIISGHRRSLHRDRFRKKLRKHRDLLRSRPMAEGTRLAEFFHRNRRLVARRSFSALATDCMGQEDSRTHCSDLSPFGGYQELISLLMESDGERP